MNYDKRTDFAGASDTLTLSTSTGRQAIGSTINLTAVTGDLGGFSEPIFLVLLAATAITIAGNSVGTLQFELVSDNVANHTTAYSHIHAYTPVLSTSSVTGALQAGSLLGAIPLPMAQLAPRTAAVTISTASPAVVTSANHGLTTNDAIVFAAGGGTLPSAIVAGTTYYAKVIDQDTYQVMTTAAGASGTGVAGTGSVGTVLMATRAIQERFYKQYLGIVQNSSIALTGGSIYAFLTTDVARWRSYADALN